MFDNIKEACRMFFKSRLVVATVVMILLFSILLWRYFFSSDCKMEKNIRTIIRSKSSRNAP